MRAITEEARKAAEFSITQDTLYRRWAADEAVSYSATGNASLNSGRSFHLHEVLPPRSPRR